MVLHILKKKKKEVRSIWMAKRGIHSPDLTLDKAKIILKLTSQESQFITYVCLISHIPKFFVQYADAIACLEFQIAPGSQVVGGNLFKLPSNLRCREWNHTAFKRC